MHQASEQYVGIVKGQIVAHTGIIQFPLKKGAKRVHRLVVLPDYQGIGIGTHFIKEIGEIIKKRGFELNLTTTTPSLVGALRKDDSWILARYGREKTGNKGYERYGIEKTKHLQTQNSCKRVTYSFWYKGR